MSLVDNIDNAMF